MFKKLGIISLEKIQAKARGVGYKLGDKLGLLGLLKGKKTDPFSYEELENIIEKNIVPEIKGPGIPYIIRNGGIEKPSEPFVNAPDPVVPGPNPKYVRPRRDL